MTVADVLDRGEPDAFAQKYERIPLARRNHLGNAAEAHQRTHREYRREKDDRAENDYENYRHAPQPRKRPERDARKDDKEGEHEAVREKEPVFPPCDDLFFHRLQHHVVDLEHGSVFADAGVRAARRFADAHEAGADAAAHALFQRDVDGHALALHGDF